MNRSLRRLLGSSIGHLPITVRQGIAEGATWSLFPWTSYWRGTHEPALQAAMMGLGSGDIHGWSCWDLGAHYGLYSIGLARRVGPEGEVAAFEPNPESYARLTLHKARNHLTWLKTYRAAASDRAGQGELLSYGQLDSTTTHLAYPGEVTSVESAPITVPTVRLDDEVDSGRLRPPRFVKVDVEGHGAPAVEGMKRAIATTRPVLFVAFHSDDEVLGVTRVLEPLGYQYTLLEGGPVGSTGLVGQDCIFTPTGA